MAGTSEGGRRAARTRGYKSLSEAGRKGGKQSRRKSTFSNKDTSQNNDIKHREKDE